MNKIKKGDIVGRISYGKDIAFVVERIIKTHNKRDVAILKGLTIRVQADSTLDDLELMNQDQVEKHVRVLEEKVEKRIKQCEYIKEGKQKSLFREKIIVYTGKILHIDGDSHLSNLKKSNNTNTSEQVIFSHI